MKKTASGTRKTRKWPFVLVFLVGFVILMYPIISQLYYRVESESQIVEFQKSAKGLSDTEIIQRMELAKAYNDTLDPGRLSDPYTDKEKEGIAEYARMLEVEEKLGFVEIPSLKTRIPIYAGTSESVLQKGAGHLEGTSLPIGGINSHCVVTAHRGLPTAELFRHLNRLKEGDVFYIHNIDDVLAYEVDQILTVEPHDFSPVLVVQGEDLATLLTCTPYMINSHRLLVRGSRIPYVAPVDDGIARDRILSMDFRDYLRFEILIALVLFILMVYFRQDMVRNRRMLDRLKKELEDSVGKDGKE